MSVLVDRMKFEDVSGVALVEEECFTQPWSYSAFLEELNNEQAVTFVAIKDMEIVGFINSRFLLDEGTINNIAVIKRCRRENIGNMLISALVDLAIQRNMSFLTLEVRKSNSDAIMLYKKHHFEQVGIRKNFYNQPQEDAILMTLKLDNSCSKKGI